MIFTRINKSRRRCVIFLDDIWSEIDMKKIGIPVGSRHTSCKVLLASRASALVGKNMGCDMSLELRVLNKQEAWDLFRGTVGDCMEGEDLQDIGKDIADECGGLPVALITIARALSGKSRNIWEDAHNQLLKGSRVSEKISEMDKRIYDSIKLSFDFLAAEGQKEAQQLLVLCCQFPENYAMKVEKLVRYCLALDFFEDVFEVQEARNKIRRLIKYLKSCFLLQAGDVNEDSEDETVTVHDVIRDVVFSIASEVKEERDNIRMHIMDREGASDSYEPGATENSYPKLKLLMNAPLDQDLLDIRFLEQMQEMRVFENAPDEVHHSLPAIQVLENLRMLSLEGARLGEDIGSKIGMLRKLQILSFSDSSIASFPCQIGQLHTLKLLDLRCREGTGPIPRGILLRLKELEDLYMGNFYFWRRADNGEEGMDAESYGRIEELDSLSNLIAFQIPHLDPMELLDLDHFPLDKLERFCFGPPTRPRLLQAQSSYRLCPPVEKILQLKGVGENWVSEVRIQKIVRSTVDLHLEDIDWTSLQMIEKFVSLRELTLTSCNCLKYIIHDTMQSGGDSTVFLDLEGLFLSDMDSVIELCQNGNLPAGSLSRLKELELCSLPSLKRLFASPVDPLCLVNLKTVVIGECPVLETIFPHSAAKALSKLHSLSVFSCEMLEAIVGDIEGRGREIKEEPNDFAVLFPELRYVEIYNLPKFRCIYDLDNNGREQSFFTPLVILPSIERLKVEGSHKLKQIVKCRVFGVQKYSASAWLQNLEKVDVASCGSLETVFDFEGVQDMRDNAVSILGNLEEITLSQLPNLNHVCWMFSKEIHAFQKLRRIEVTGCDSLVYLLSCSMAHILVNLESLSIENCKSVEEVIKVNEDSSEDKKIVFRSLVSVALGHSQKLSSFCPSEQQDFEFPSLVEVSIIQCPMTKTFCMGNLTAEKLSGVKFAYSSSGDDCAKTVWKDDLNETIRQFNQSVTLEDGVVPVEDVKKFSDPVESVVHEHVQNGNEVLDHSGTGGSTGTPPEQCPSPPDEKDLAHSSGLDLNEVAVPTSRTDSQLQPKTDKELSYSSLSSPYGDWSGRILVQGVYVKADMKTTFEEILKANPNFLSKLRFKKPEMKTFFVESAICCLDNLRQCTACTISPESLASIKDSLDDLESSGLDMAWLKRGYKRASLVLEKQNVVSALAKLARLERETAEVEADFKIVKGKLEKLKVQRDTSKAECDALMQKERATGNELFGGGFSIETSLGDGLLG